MEIFHSLCNICCYGEFRVNIYQPEIAEQKCCQISHFTLHTDAFCTVKTIFPIKFITFTDYDSMNTGRISYLNLEIFQVNFSLLSILTIFSIICLFPITRPKVQRSTLTDETSMERKDSVHSRTGTTDVRACARREIRFPLQYIYFLNIYREG